MSSSASRSALTVHSTVTAGSESKKSVIILLRWLLVIASSYLILFGGTPEQFRTISHVVVCVLILSNLCLSAFPSHWFSKPWFDFALILVDVSFISCSMWFMGEVNTEFYLLYFIIIMVAAVSETFASVVTCAVIISLVSVGITMQRHGLSALVDVGVLIKIPFYFVVAVFYGYFAQRVRIEQTENASYRRKLGAATKLRRMSIRLTRLLDRNEILETLLRTVEGLTHSKTCFVLSVGSREIVTERGDKLLNKSDKNLTKLFYDVQNVLSNRVKVQSTIESTLRGGEDVALAHISFSGQQFTLLPISAADDADLYLALEGKLDKDQLEWVRILLLSASHALHNAGQYQELLHEVENRKQMALQLSQALEFKSEFLANISHEVRTPIYSFIGFGELLLDGGYGALDDEQHEVISRMVENAQGLLELVNGILDLSKYEAGELQLRNDPDVLETFITDVVDTCRPLLKDKPVSLRAAVESCPPLVTDWGILRQIAMNLISNAVKFTERGSITVRSEYDYESEQLILQVTDTGIGIPADKLGEIFEAFRQLDNSYTKRYAGTGLGLSITKKHVTMLNGTIDVNSRLGRGSQFTVVIPVALASASGVRRLEERRGPLQSDDDLKPYGL